MNQGPMAAGTVYTFLHHHVGTEFTCHVWTPLDLERRFGLPEGNIYHGEMTLDQVFFMRPVPGASRYRASIDGLYLCGAAPIPAAG